MSHESSLPDWDAFPVHWLAKRWRVSAHHVADLVEEGEITGAIELCGKAASRSLIRITRVGVIEFEMKRKVTSTDGNAKNGHSR
jgi:hypothetical protein